MDDEQDPVVKAMRALRAVMQDPTASADAKVDALRALQRSHGPYEPMQSFEYTGRIEVRPVGRGVLLVDAERGPDGQASEFGPEQGSYQAVIRLVRIPDIDPDEVWPPDSPPDD